MVNLSIVRADDIIPFLNETRWNPSKAPPLPGPLPHFEWGEEVPIGEATDYPSELV